RGAAQGSRDGGGDHLGGVRTPVVAALEAVGWRVGLRVVGPREPVLEQVEGPAVDMIGADVVRLEERPEGVVLLLGDRIEEVVVAPGAVQGVARNALAVCSTVACSHTFRL